MLYLVLASATLEGKSTIDAMRRSRQLVSGKWFKTFCLLAGIQIIIAVISNLVGGIAGLPFSGETSTMAAVVTSNFVTALSFPLVSASMLVLYHSNLAKQKEYIPRPPSLYDRHETAAHSRLSCFAEQFLSKVQRFSHARREILPQLRNTAANLIMLINIFYKKFEMPGASGPGWRLWIPIFAMGSSR